MQVRLELGRRSVKVVGLSMLATPAVQRPSLEGSLVVPVVVDGKVAVIYAFDDPRINRGASQPERPGHSYVRTDSAIVNIRVPLSPEWSGGTIAIRMFNLARYGRRPIDVEGLQKWVESRNGELPVVADIATEQLRAHRDWSLLGLSGQVAEPLAGHFAIYRDRAGKYRWRLISDDGKIVANSGQGFVTRAVCEADLRWIREHGAKVPIRALDME